MDSRDSVRTCSSARLWVRSFSCWAKRPVSSDDGEKEEEAGGSVEGCFVFALAFAFVSIWVEGVGPIFVCGFALFPLAAAAAAAPPPPPPDVPCPRRALSTDDNWPAALCIDPSASSDTCTSKPADADRAGA